MKPTRVLVADASEKTVRLLSETVGSLDGYEAVSASTLAEVVVRMASADAAVVGLSYPDAHDAAQVLEGVCGAAEQRGVPVVVVLGDVHSEDSAHVWTYSKCVRGVLSKANIEPETVFKALTAAGAGAFYRPWRRYDPTQWRDPAIDAISLKIDQLLESNRETRVQLVQHLSRIAKVEDHSARRDVQVERLVRAFRGALRRLKKIDVLVSGDPSTGSRSLVVRIDDLERAREKDEKDAETRSGWGVQIVSQLLPWVLSAVFSAAMAWIAYQVKSGH